MGPSTGIPIHILTYLLESANIYRHQQGYVHIIGKGTNGTVTYVVLNVTII